MVAAPYVSPHRPSDPDVYDTAEDEWLVRQEETYRSLDPDRYSAEWGFDDREEANRMLEEVLGEAGEEAGRTPRAEAASPEKGDASGSDRDVG